MISPAISAASASANTGAVAEAPQVELQALALDAPLARHVLDLDGRHVGLAGDRAHRRQLLGREADLGDVGRRREHLDVVDRRAAPCSEHRQLAALAEAIDPTLSRDARPGTIELTC